MGELFTAAIGLVCSIVSSIATFFLTRRKYNTEVDSQQIENMSKAFDVHKKIMESNLEAQKEVMQMEIEALKTDYEIVKKENDSLRQQVSQLQMQMINILGSICLDATCKMRKMNFSSDLKFGDNGPSLVTDK